MHCVFLSLFGFVVGKLGLFVGHTLIVWVGLCFAIDEEHAIPLKICSKEGHLHL
jgi:hypothetical protein